MKKTTTLEKVIKERGVVTVEQLSKILDMSGAAIRYRLRECERKDKVKTYFCCLRGARGSQKYKANNFFNATFIGKILIYIDPAKFIEFFEKNILKFELDENLSSGKKSALTHHIKSAMPDEIVKSIRAKYIKKKEDI